MGTWIQSKGEGKTMTPEEKLAKIEELMHPGFWSAYDYRREAVLKVLGSERSSWYKEPEEYAGR